MDGLGDKVLVPPRSTARLAQRDTSDALTRRINTDPEGVEAAGAIGTASAGVVYRLLRHHEDDE